MYNMYTTPRWITMFKKIEENKNYILPIQMMRINTCWYQIAMQQICKIFRYDMYTKSLFIIHSEVGLWWPNETKIEDARCFFKQRYR